MDLNAHITEVNFLPKDHLTITGSVWSKSTMSRKVSKDEQKGFTIAWFWFSDMPEPVGTVLIEAANKMNILLQDMNAIPKEWPLGLGVEKTTEHPFTFEMQNFHIVNPNWIGYRDGSSSVAIAVRSNHHESTFSTVKLKLDEEYCKKLFEVLEEWL